MNRASWTGLAATCLGAVLVLIIRNRRQRQGLPLPPGPRPRWFVGNLFDVPRAYPWLRFSEWGRTYGEISYATILGKPIVILNSLAACKELMTSASGRPYTIMIELLGMSKDMTSQQETPMWRYGRRLTQSALSPQAAKAYYSLQQMYAATFIRRMFDNPKADCMAELRDALGKSIFAVTYGLPTGELFDEFMRLNKIVSEAFFPTMEPGRYLVESIPILRYVPTWFPGAAFKRHARHIKHHFEIHASLGFDAVKKEIAAGTAAPSFVANCLEALQASEKESQLPSRAYGENAVKYAAGEMYRAGTHTTVQTVVKFITAMQLYPSVQRKAQEEIARVIGPDRLPTVEDRDSLPYLNALITECHRWHPSVALGLAHRTTKDEVYEGYLVPKDTSLFCNQWNLSLVADDGTPLDAPDDFVPERFLPDALGTARPLDPREYVFGFGRRICPGRYLAENILFITISNILATSWISNPVDGNGDEIPLNIMWTGEDLVSFPEPFRPLVEPRSALAVELIHAASEAGSARDVERR